ncbi:MAG: ATP-binding cassette domain-containing protein, partial [Chloroflexi bacterium]|nr:ATP-binding cassette domain-containing protein [Chloroflexota bacterium]
MTLALEATGLIAGYGEADILHDVSIKVERGEMVAVIGPNGAGKSTLLKAIFGLLPARAGEVRLGSEDITNHTPDRIVAAGMS